jgi:hypothetical protein
VIVMTATVARTRCKSSGVMRRSAPMPLRECASRQAAAQAAAMIAGLPGVARLAGVVRRPGVARLPGVARSSGIARRGGASGSPGMALLRGVQRFGSDG